MAYTNITIQEVDRDGPTEDTAATQTAAIAHNVHADGHSFLNDGKTCFLSVRNGAGVRQLFVYIPATVDGQAVTMQTYNLAATTDYKLGPFPASVYNQADGDVHFGSDGPGALTYAPWRIFD